MKIKELKELLAQIPESMDNEKICSVMEVGCCGDTEFLDIVDADIVPADNKPDDHPLKYKGTLRIVHGSIEGYRSCRQVSDTLKRDKEYWEQFPSSQWYKKYKGEE